MQLDEIAEENVAVGLEQAHMARGGNRVGALVVGDGVGEKNLIPLAQLDTALGDDQPEIFVVLYLVGAEQDGCLLALRGTPDAADSGSGGLRRRGGERGESDDRGAAHAAQPSSR